MTAKLELHRRRNRRAQKLSRVEKQIMKAQAAFDKTKSFVWAVRLKDLRTKALSLSVLAPARLCNSAKGKLNQGAAG